MKKVIRRINLIRKRFLSVGKILSLLRFRLTNYLLQGLLRLVDLLKTSYSSADIENINHHTSGLRNRNINLPDLGIDALAQISNYYLKHCFDILGSGWARVYYGARGRAWEKKVYSMSQTLKHDLQGNWLRGRINASNLSESNKIWRLIQDENYTPIDWQLDFKSGYRWSERTWYKDIRYGNLPGVDIKVPWELARMQHLPQLAIAYFMAINHITGFMSPEIYRLEFRNQVLDFIATNPPRWGVNWSCSMEVAIRVCNWLIAFDLFHEFGAKFDKDFEKVFFRSIYEHGLHILNNLEWSPFFRNNHYLANIVGLVFSAAYLPSKPEINRMLVFAIRELIHEVKNQFNDDGTHFEASTCYHHLTAEMVIYATALILGLTSEKIESIKNSSRGITFYTPLSSGHDNPFPKWYFPLLKKMINFSICIKRSDGTFPQIGDNDSGRFFKIFPKYRKVSNHMAGKLFLNLKEFDEYCDCEDLWFEYFLDNGHIITAFQGLLNFQDFPQENNLVLNEAALVKALSNLAIINTNYHNLLSSVSNEIGDVEEWVNFQKRIENSPFDPVIFCFHSSRNLRQKMTCYAFPDFGLFIIKSPCLYMAIRCGSKGQNGLGGHAHNDQLSVELTIGDVDIYRDPGSYLYTPFPEIRNRYRSVKAHFAPRYGDAEPGDLYSDLFSIGGDPQSKVLYFGRYGFLGRHDGFGFPVFRHIEILETQVVITDFSPHVQLSKIFPEKVPFSPAYGVILNPSISIMENQNVIT
ncbi:heparinase II/III-like protein [Bellilinea caldifistulae]|uniref:heparinase II/III family protein n=1 Tax=Bellilinea caldifistulae TaxID=360411 RepID=UPI0009E54DB4|nr:heparinase II/III family protein [Bellilinea caldifistulae]GAP09590.1 heparinase II/III-like protein [Bellilinea caldifistulae]